MSVVKDPELLRELKPIWRRFGCAICGRTVSDETESGFDVELAHIHGRGMGGGKRQDTVEEILGLCGGLTPNRCHPRFDAHEIVVFANTMGDEVWQVKSGDGVLVQPLEYVGAIVTKPKEIRFGRVRRPHLNGRAERTTSAISAAGGSEGETIPAPVRSAGPLMAGALAVSRNGEDAAGGPGPIPGEPSTALERREAVVDSGPPTNVRLAEGFRGGAPIVPHTPETRYELLRGLVRTAEAHRLAASIVLLKAWEDAEYELLGMSWPEYYQSVGIAKAECSKMLLVARTFRGKITELPEHDREELSLERAYYAARLVKAETLSHSDALAAAISTPAAGLVQMLKSGVASPEPERCVCAACGNNHAKPELEP